MNKLYPSVRLDLGITRSAPLSLAGSGVFLQVSSSGREEEMSRAGNSEYIMGTGRIPVLVVGSIATEPRYTVTHFNEYHYTTTNERGGRGEERGRVKGGQRVEE